MHEWIVVQGKDAQEIDANSIDSHIQKKRPWPFYSLIYFSSFLFLSVRQIYMYNKSSYHLHLTIFDYTFYQKKNKKIVKNKIKESPGGIENK